MGGQPIESRRRGRVGVYLLGLLIGLSCAAVWAEPAALEDFEIGQRWEYQHEGPRPGSTEPNAIGGERILQVISVAQGEENHRQWVIEERFTHSRDVIGRFYVDQEQMLTALEIENKKGEVAKLRYDPPVPYRAMGLRVGEKRKIETALKMDSPEFTLPSTIVIERLEDETVTVPAGEFAGCLHYRAVTVSTVNIKIAKIPFTEEREQWYHASVHGLVKEVYRRGPIKFLTWSRPGYTATSVLAAYGKEEGKAAVAPVTETDTRGRGQNEPEGSGQGIRSPGRTNLVLLGILIGICAAGGLLWAKRAGRKQRL